MKREIPTGPPCAAGHIITPPMLINEISSLFDMAMRGDEPEIGGLKRGGRLLLLYLAAEDNQTQYDLTVKTHLSAPSVSVALSKLEAAGYVERVKDTDDQRAVRVRLTPLGIEANDNIRAKLNKYDAVLMRGIEGRDKEVLLRLLVRVRNNILTEVSGENNEKIN